MKLTTASMDLEDDQASTKNIELNEIVVRGGQLSYKSIKHVVSVILNTIVFFFFFSIFPIPSLWRVFYII